MDQPGSSEEITPSNPVDAPPAGTPVARRRRLPHLRPIHIPVRVHTLDALRYRSFRLLWGVVFWSSAAMWLQQVVIGWLIYDLTRSPLLTSVAMGLGAMAILLVGPFAGFLVDIFDRRVLLVRAFAGNGVLVFGFAILVAADRVGPAHILAFALLSGLTSAVAEPAKVSMTAKIVPKEGLMNAFALTTLAMGITRLTAPALGGLLISISGPETALLAQSTCMFAAATFAMSLRFEDSPPTGARLSSALTGLLEAARYVVGEKVILALFMFATFPALSILPFVMGLAPVYAREVFDVGPASLGLLLAAPGLGMIMGTTVVASVGNIQHRGRVILASCLMAVVAMVAFSQNSSYRLALVNLVVLTSFTPVIFTVAQAAIQSTVRDEIRGRVTGLMMAGWGLFPIFSLVAGALAERFSAQTATLAGAGLLMGGTIVLLAIFPFMRRLE